MTDTEVVGRLSKDGIPFSKIYYITELPLHVKYRVLKYKRVYGSCGIYFIFQARKVGTSEIIFVRVNDGNLHSYFKEKTSKFRFTIEHEKAESEECHINVNGKGDWIELTEKPSTGKPNGSDES